MGSARGVPPDYAELIGFFAGFSVRPDERGHDRREAVRGGGTNEGMSSAELAAYFTEHFGAPVRASTWSCGGGRVEATLGERDGVPVVWMSCVRPGATPAMLFCDVFDARQARWILHYIDLVARDARGAGPLPGNCPEAPSAIPGAA